MTSKKQKLIEGPVDGYKGTDMDMKCRGFQFKMGMNTLPGNEELELCRYGFHFCQQPSGPHAYGGYARIFRVKAYNVLDVPWEPGANYKQVCRKVEFIEEVVLTGDGNTGYSNTGDRNTGDGNTGDSNTGYGNTGDSNTGYSNTGDRNTGDCNTGNGNTGFGNTGNRNTGYRNTGDRNTGYGNTGNSNTGHRNIGNSNTGYGNTGAGNTGDCNTGNGNTGFGNTGNRNTGFFCMNEPAILFFDEPTELTRDGLDWPLIRQLSEQLSQDKPFDYSLYLQLPNATPERIKALHKAHSAARQRVTPS